MTGTRDALRGFDLVALKIEDQAVVAISGKAHHTMLATGPNQVCSWDITKLLGSVKWTYYYLYVLLDIFSRYVVRWLLARQESAALAKVLITESCERQHIAPDQLTIHADRGPSMTSQPVALLLWRPWAWCPRILGPTSPMTTPSPRRSSRPSSTGRTSRRGSAPTRMRRSANGSSRGTTSSTVMAPLA